MSHCVMIDDNKVKSLVQDKADQQSKRNWPMQSYYRALQKTHEVGHKDIVGYAQTLEAHNQFLQGRSSNVF